jgi:hypothetical protein
MTVVLEDARTLLRTLVRSIDKGIDYTVALHEGDRPGVTLNVSFRKASATILIPAEQLENAQQDSMQRAQLRTSIKRTVDRMTFKPNEVASTKMVRGAVVDGGFFRTQSGPRGGGRR